MNALAEAFYQQAESDFAAAMLLKAQPGHFSQAMMLLQMAWEKLGKAALSEAGEWTLHEQGHNVAGKFVRVLGRNEAFLKAYGGRTGVRQLEHALAGLQGLRPHGTHAKNTEYPWEEGGVIRWPARDLLQQLPVIFGFRLWKDFTFVWTQFPQVFAP